MTVHSNDRPSWLTKLERIGELSARNKEMVFNNIGHLLNADMLKEQYQQLDGKKDLLLNKNRTFFRHFLGSVLYYLV